MLAWINNWWYCKWNMYSTSISSKICQNILKTARDQHQIFSIQQWEPTQYVNNKYTEKFICTTTHCLTCRWNLNYATFIILAGFSLQICLFVTIFRFSRDMKVMLHTQLWQMYSILILPQQVKNKKPPILFFFFENVFEILWTLSFLSVKGIPAFKFPHIPLTSLEKCIFI